VCVCVCKKINFYFIFYLNDLSNDQSSGQIMLLCSKEFFYFCRTISRIGFSTAEYYWTLRYDKSINEDVIPKSNTIHYNRNNVIEWLDIGKRKHFEIHPWFKYNDIAIIRRNSSFHVFSQPIPSETILPIMRMMMNSATGTSTCYAQHAFLTEI